MKKEIFLILLLAFLLRLVSLSQSFWLDEAITAQVVKNYSFWQILTKFSPSDFHPPFYYLFIKLWSLIFGYSEVSLRFPSIIFSLLTGYLLYKHVNKWASILFLFNPLIIYYSQEARMYSLATFLLSLGFVLFLKEKKFSLASLIAFSLALFTFYGSLFFILSLIIYCVFYNKKEAIKLGLTTLISLLLLFPLLKIQLQNSKLMLSTVKNWSLVLGKANFKNLLLIPVKFSVGRISFYPKYLYYFLAGLWTAFVFSSFKNIKKDFKSKASAFVFFSTLALVFLVSFVKPMLQYFRVLYLITPMSIILSESSNFKKSLILIGFTIFSLIYLLLPNFHREDWKKAVYELKGGEIIYIIPQVKAPLEYYAEKFGKKIKIKPLNEALKAKNLPQNSLIFPYAAEILGIEIDSEKFKTVKTYRNIQILKLL